MKKFKAIMAMAAIILFLGTLSTGYADEKYRYFEMGESGQVVAFPLTAEEIAAEVRLTEKRSMIVRNPVEENVVRFEMGESGQTAAFPMTAKEIASREAAAKLQAEIAAANRPEPKGRVVVYEMGESGQTVAFPLKDHEVVESETEAQRLARMNKGAPEVTKASR